MQMHDVPGAGSACDFERSLYGPHCLHRLPQTMLWLFGHVVVKRRPQSLASSTKPRSAARQVIIPNYIQAASNCIVSGQHYLVCCVNDCEVMLDEIERKVAAPTAPLHKHCASAWRKAT